MLAVLQQPLAFVAMSSYADEAHRAWLTEALTNAATEAGVSLVGDPVFGWRDRTVGSRVRAADGEYWLRVVSEQQAWTDGDFWTGNVDASVISGVAKPMVLRHRDWEDGTRCLRAELMTLLPGRVCSPTPELRRPVDLSSEWWRALHTSLHALARVDTSRRRTRQQDVTRRLLVFFGDRVDDQHVTQWVPAHTDLHWANLLKPDCVILDWEGWGLAPAGYDAATLLVHSLLVPEMADRVHDEFSHQLDGRDGLLAQLYAVGRMLLRINTGDYPDLAVPLHRHAERVIDQLSRRR